MQSEIQTSHDINTPSKAALYCAVTPILGAFQYNPETFNHVNCRSWNIQLYVRMCQKYILNKASHLS